MSCKPIHFYATKLNMETDRFLGQNDNLLEILIRLIMKHFKIKITVNDNTHPQRHHTVRKERLL